MGFFNTVRLKGSTLASAVLSAEKQDAAVYKLFRDMQQPLTPIKAHSLLVQAKGWHNVPLTSIRRSISNLTKRGVLEKTPHKEIEAYGKPNYTWRIKSHGNNDTRSN